MKPDLWCKHEVRGFSLKFKQVQKRIMQEHCFVWVKFGETFRDATYDEALKMRQEEIRLPLGMFYWVEVTGRDGKVKMVAKPYLAELHECHTRWSTVEQQTAFRQSWPLIAEANRLAAQNG